jgi:hypothetical protein
LPLAQRAPGAASTGGALALIAIMAIAANMGIVRFIVCPILFYKLPYVPPLAQLGRFYQFQALFDMSPYILLSKI